MSAPRPDTGADAGTDSGTGMTTNAAAGRRSRVSVRRAPSVRPTPMRSPREWLRAD